MARRYTLDTKIHALNLIDQQDGDVLFASDELMIPTRTLHDWRKLEIDLRQAYREKLQRQFLRLKEDLQVKLLERVLQIVEQMDDETLETAPLNQLTTTLNTLVNHALKLEEANEDKDEEQEKVFRIEYVYDGSVHKTPPWATRRVGEPITFQHRRVRKTVGENGTGENHRSGEFSKLRNADLVAGSNVSDVESGVEGLEDEFDERDWYHD